jgi:hypothetical protein
MKELEKPAEADSKPWKNKPVGGSNPLTDGQEKNNMKSSSLTKTLTTQVRDFYNQEQEFARHTATSLSNTLPQTN